MAPATAVKTASAAEAGAPARRKTPFLTAMAETAQGARPNAALTARLGIAASGPVVAPKRLWRSFGAVVITLCAFAVPA